MSYKVRDYIKASIVLAALGSTSCGVKISDTVVIGSTSYLKEVNRGKKRARLENHTLEDKGQLNALIRKY